MAFKYAEKQLSKLDKELLIYPYLEMQDQMAELTEESNKEKSPNLYGLQTVDKTVRSVMSANRFFTHFQFSNLNSCWIRKIAMMKRGIPLPI